MCERSRAGRFEVRQSPNLMQTYTQDRGAWYETPEEVEAGLEWGKEKAALLQWVRRQMGRRLTARERRCLELYYFEGLTCREVGTRTGTNPSSAYRAIRRAVQKLKRAQERCKGDRAPATPKVRRSRKRD